MREGSGAAPHEPPRGFTRLPRHLREKHGPSALRPSSTPQAAKSASPWAAQPWPPLTGFGPPALPPGARPPASSHSRTRRRALPLGGCWPAGREWSHPPWPAASAGPGRPPDRRERSAEGGGPRAAPPLPVTSVPAPFPHCGEHCYPPFPLPGASAPKLWGHFPAETQLCVLITPRVRERGEGQRLAEERTPGVRGGAPGPSPSPLVLPGSEGPARRCRRGHPPRLLRPASRDSPARPSALHERQCRRLLRSLEVVRVNRKHQRPCR